MENSGIPVVAADLILLGGMVTVTLLAASLWRAGGIQQRAGAVLLILESAALSGVAVSPLAFWLSLDLEPRALGLAPTWAPAIGGLVVGVAIAAWRRR